MKPTTFRIIPVEHGVFHVHEKRRFWLGWKTCGHRTFAYGHTYFSPRTFGTNDAAMEWIADEIDRRDAVAKHMATPPVVVHVDA